VRRGGLRCGWGEWRAATEGRGCLRSRIVLDEIEQHLENRLLAFFDVFRVFRSDELGEADGRLSTDGRLLVADAVDQPISQLFVCVTAGEYMRDEK
jgi:hypothetical protein